MPEYNFYAGPHELRIEANPIEVTSMHRPDTNWEYVDEQGHRHCWYVEGKEEPAGVYDAGNSYYTPTLRWVKEGTEYYPDGSPYEVGHHECVDCGEEVEKKYTSDTHPQYIQGPKRFYIDDRGVDKEEFEEMVNEIRDDLE